jgi:glycosyltransferase involved in cell wall biosynthesis
MSAFPFFSVVIPTYNRATLLREALASVLAQEYSDFEVVVVDDGSTDETEAVVRASGLPAQFLRQTNSGPGATRNRGIQAARGVYVTFLDSDDLWFPWTLATFAQIIRQENNPSWIVGAPREFRSPAELTTCRREAIRQTSYRDYLASSGVDAWVPGCGAVIRRDVLQSAGGFTDKWINAEDSDLWLRLGEAKNFIHLQSPHTLAYRCHANTAVANSRRLWDGMQNLIAQESEGNYPGKQIRQKDRWRILTRHTRSGSKALSQAGWNREAWGLYRDTFTWNIRLGNWKYLVGFWPHLAVNLTHKRGSAAE